MDEASLTKLVEESFSDTIRPADAHIFEDYEPARQVFLKFLEMIKGKDWKEFLHVLQTDGYMVQFCSSMFGHMTSEAKYYFMPALLIFSMNKKADRLADTTLYYLSPDRVYTTRQKHAIAQIIHHIGYHFGEDDSDYEFVRNVWVPWLDVAKD